MAADPVSTAVAAKALGVSRSTLARWAKQKKITPAYTTPGGQYRWNMADLRRQLHLRPADPDQS